MTKTYRNSQSTRRRFDKNAYARSDSSAKLSRTSQNCDQARNEKQKAVLLKKSLRLAGERSAGLLKVSLNLIARSNALVTKLKAFPSSIEEQERKMMTLALRVAGTYCEIAETHTHRSHRADALRLAGKAKEEIAAVEARIDKNKVLFGTQIDSVTARLLKLKKRIQSLEQAVV